MSGCACLPKSFPAGAGGKDRRFCTPCAELSLAMQELSPTWKTHGHLHNRLLWYTTSAQAVLPAPSGRAPVRAATKRRPTHTSRGGPRARAPSHAMSEKLRPCSHPHQHAATPALTETLRGNTSTPKSSSIGPKGRAVLQRPSRTAGEIHLAPARFLGHQPRVHLATPLPPERRSRDCFRSAGSSLALPSRHTPYSAGRWCAYPPEDLPRKASNGANVFARHAVNYHVLCKSTAPSHRPMTPFSHKPQHQALRSRRSFLHCPRVQL